MKLQKKESNVQLVARLAGALSRALSLIELERRENERLRASLKIAEELIFASEAEAVQETADEEAEAVQETADEKVSEAIQEAAPKEKEESWKEEVVPQTVKEKEKEEALSKTSFPSKKKGNMSPAALQMVQDWKKIVGPDESRFEITVHEGYDETNLPVKMAQLTILGRDAFPWHLPVPEHYLEKWPNEAWGSAYIMMLILTNVKGVGKMRPLSYTEDPGLSVKQMAGAFGMAYAFWGFGGAGDAMAFVSIILGAARKVSGGKEDLGRAVDAITKAFCDPNSGVKLKDSDPIVKPGFQGRARRTKSGMYRFAYGVRPDAPPEPLKLGWRNDNFYENGR